MKRTELYMSGDMLDDLNELGKENDVSRAEIVRTLVEYGLEHSEDIDFGEEPEGESEEEEEPEEETVDDLEDETKEEEED